MGGGGGGSKYTLTSTNVHILNQMDLGKHKKVHWKQHDAFFLIYYHKTD